jgi:hypothetical protein
MPYRDPEKRRASVREAVRRHRAVVGGKPAHKPSTLPDLASLRVKTATDVLSLLNGQVERVQAARVGVLEQARVVGYLAGLMLRAIEVGTLAERIETMEKRLQDTEAGVLAEERGDHEN